MTSSSSQTAGFDRYAQIGNLALTVRSMLNRIWLPMIAVLGGETILLLINKSPAAISFALIAAGTLVPFGVWRHKGIGLPLLPLIALQHLIVYGLPIVTGHPVVYEYPQNYVTEAGLEVLVFGASMAAAWWLALEFFTPSPPVSYALPDFQQEGSDKLKRLGLNLAIVGTLYQVVEKAGALEFLFALLPTGSSSLVVPLVTGISACGFFLVSLFVGGGEIDQSQRLLFWTLLILSTAISASGFLLSAATTMVAAVVIGLFWSSGRIPWRFLTVVIVVLSFFSVSKFTMRGRYWEFDEQLVPTSTGLVQMPAVYLEWTEASLDALTAAEPEARFTSTGLTTSSNQQTLLDRINNLQNLLFVIDAIKTYNIAPLGGASYSLIPPLLVPRIMWPDKPRTHEGQVLLNVHFGRQDLNSTYKTYVAWGLLPEAYGNFGSMAGSIVVGVFLGVFFCWLENLTARKLLLSLEGFLSFTVLLGFAGSFEMVASVLVTMIFQSVIPIMLACMPFLRRMTVTRPEAPPA